MTLLDRLFALVAQARAGLVGATFDEQFDELVRAAHDVLDASRAGSLSAPEAAVLARLSLHVALTAYGVEHTWDWRAELTARVVHLGDRDPCDALVHALVALGECRRLAPDALDEMRAERAVDVAAAALFLGLACFEATPAPPRRLSQRVASDAPAGQPS